MKAAQTGVILLKPDSKRPDRLKPVLNGSNQTIPAQIGQDHLKSDHTGPDRLKLGTDWLNRIKQEQTGSNWF